MSNPIEISADYRGIYVTAARGPSITSSVTLTSAEVETALRNIADGKYDVLDCGSIVLDESDLLAMREALEQRARKLADLKADATRGEA